MRSKHRFCKKNIENALKFVHTGQIDIKLAPMIWVFRIGLHELQLSYGFEQKARVMEIFEPFRLCLHSICLGEGKSQRGVIDYIGHFC